MSIAEALLRESLDLVLHVNEPRIFNVRPDNLKNPFTGNNLELDVFLPRFPIGIEVQGPHHYRDEGQMFRDSVKRELCKKNDIHLIEISIFETRPVYIRAKLLDYSKAFKKHVNVQPRDSIKWNALDRKITHYRKQILSKFGNSEDYTPPHEKLKREEHLKQNFELSKCLYVILNVDNKHIRVKPIKWSRSNKVTVKLLGDTDNNMFKVNRTSIVNFV